MERGLLLRLSSLTVFLYVCWQAAIAFGDDQQVSDEVAKQQACVALASLNKDSTDMFVQALVGVDRVTSRTIAGTLYTVEFFVANTNCKKTETEGNGNDCKVTEPIEVQLCSTTIMSQPWLKQDPSVNAVMCQEPPEDKKNGNWAQIQC